MIKTIPKIRLFVGSQRVMIYMGDRQRMIRMKREEMMKILYRVYRKEKT